MESRLAEDKREGSVDHDAAKPGSNRHLKHDVALQLVDTHVAGNISPEEAKQVLRRIDFVMMPVMFITYALQYMDKSCLTGSALFGILSDLQLVQALADPCSQTFAVHC